MRISRGPPGVGKDSRVKFLGAVVKFFLGEERGSGVSGSVSPRIFFLLRRLVFGLVFGDVRGSGLGISLFWFMRVPGRVPSGLMQVDAVVCFRDWGLFWALFGVSWRIM